MKNPMFGAKDNRGSSPEQSLESAFEREYAHRERLYRRMEQVEIAVGRLRDRYKKYEGLSRFVDYLGATEKLFLEMPFKKENLKDLKKRLIETDMSRLAQELGIEKEVLVSIREEFQSSQSSVQAVFDAADRLMNKYEDCAECKKFILYVRDIHALFLEVGNEEVSSSEFHDRLVMAKMKALSFDGDPELATLETIYNEFRKELGLKKH